MIMATPIYRFFLQIEDGTKTLCHPIYKSDVTLDYQLESGKKFFRRQLNGKLTFVREDYTLIMSATYEQTMTLYMEISTDMGLTWTQYWEGTFSRTDLTIDFADKVVTVQPTVKDAYKAVLDGIEKEYNLIELAPQTDRVLVTKRPLIQTYVPGDTVVSCFLSGSHWEEDAEEVTSGSELINTYRFALNTILKEIELTAVGGLSDAVGTYSGRVIAVDDIGTYNGTLNRSDGRYKITIESTGGQIPSSQWTWQTTVATLIRTSDNASLYRYQTSGDFDNRVFDMPPVSGSGMSGKMVADMWTYNIYARLLCDVEALNGSATNTIPDDDIVTNNRNYRRCAGYAVPIAFISNRSQTDPTKYGRRDDGSYFLPPYTLTGEKFYPIAQSTWRYASLWFAHNYVDEQTDVRASKKYMLRDAYEIASCINVLLQKVAPSIMHEATTDYSSFLYSGTNPVSGDKWRLYMTQKTNILKGEYTEPASKAVTTLQEILKMLENVFNCYWFVDNGKLRIEHISWFKNGGSYTAGSRQVGYDLTALTNIKNGKPWAFGQGEVTFDKQDLPERYQYGWMDETTEPFDGQPIEINSPNAEGGKIEDVTISGFTSDVDYMLLNPSECSNDGFVLLAVVNANILTRDDSQGYYPGFWGSHGEAGGNSTPLYPVASGFAGKTCHVRMECAGSGRAEAHFFDADGETIAGCYYHGIQQGVTEFDMYGTIPEGAVSFGFFINQGSMDFNVFSVNVDSDYELPFVSKRIDNAQFRLQNGYLSMFDLQPKYLTYDLPSRNISVNGAETTARGMSRKAKQTVTFPADAISLDTNVLIKTLVGFGEINSLSLNLSSRTIKATLNYENDVQ